MYMIVCFMYMYEMTFMNLIIIIKFNVFFPAKLLLFCLRSYTFYAFVNFAGMQNFIFH